MSILPDRDELTTPADGDLFVTTDVSDVTDAATGTDKKITWASIKAALLSVIENVTSIAFDITTTADAAKGEIRWDNDLETFVFGIDGASVPLNQPFYIVRNSTGGTLTKGTPVYATGTIGASSRITVDKMIADGSISSRLYLGVLLEDVLNGADGIAISQGKMRNLDTSAFTDGDILYVSDTVAGTFTSTEPTAPNLKLPIAFVVLAHASNGSIETRAETGQSLEDLHDIDITSVASGEIIKWDGTKWVNVPFVESNSIASDATPNPTGGSVRNEYYLTALAVAAAFVNPSGTAANGNSLMIRIKDNATARALTWGTEYAGLEDALPSTTIISDVMYLRFVYNSTSTKWELVELTNETAAGGGADISCSVHQNATTAFGTANTYGAAIAFQAENFDTSAFHDNATNNTRITIPEAGKYMIGATVCSRVNNGSVMASLKLNATTYIATNGYVGGNGFDSFANVSTIYDFAASDYIEVFASAVSGTGPSSGDGETHFWAYKID